MDRGVMQRRHGDHTERSLTKGKSCILLWWWWMRFRWPFTHLGTGICFQVVLAAQSVRSASNRKQVPQRTIQSSRYPHPECFMLHRLYLYSIALILHSTYSHSRYFANLDVIAYHLRGIVTILIVFSRYLSFLMVYEEVGR